MKTRIRNILFICKYNRFRSRVAEAYFKKINKDKGIKIDSAGLIKGSPLIKEQIADAKKFGLNINGIRKGLSSEFLRKQEIIVIVADDVPKGLLKNYNKKIIRWEIKDACNDSEKERIRIIKQVIKKADKLLKDLERKK